ncbi:MAG: tol-pal system protein YbgF, partial [Alphaproteobacteria bacterium]
PAQVPDVSSRLQPLDQPPPPRPVTPLPAVEPPPPVWPQDRQAQAEPPPSTEPPTATFGTPMTPPPSDDVPRDVDVAKDLARGGSEEYRSGLEAYQRGDYPKAIQLLRGFATKEPKSELVPIARYWIGESYFAQRRYNEAILSYNEILVGAPKSERVPAALLRQAVAFFELGDKIDARLILQKLVADHPGSEEAAAAKRKLLVLGA